MAAKWFGRMVLLGVGANLLLALPTLFRTEAAFAMLGVPPPTPLLWPRFAALLLILLSAFYVPGGIDPLRYRVSAWLAVLSRLAGVIFFSFQPVEYRLLEWFDLVFLVPQAVLLMLAFRA